MYFSNNSLFFQLKRLFPLHQQLNSNSLANPEPPHTLASCQQQWQEGALISLNDICLRPTFATVFLQQLSQFFHAKNVFPIASHNWSSHLDPTLSNNHKKKASYSLNIIQCKLPHFMSLVK
jgi:hypothetical protein